MEDSMKEKDVKEGNSHGSSKVPFMIAGCTAGMAIGFFFATDSGRRARTAIKSIATKDFPDKIEQARHVIEERSARWADKGQRIVNKMQGLMMLQRDRFVDAVESAKQSYYDRDGAVLHHLREIDTRASGISENLHKSIDSLQDLVATAHSSIFERVYEWGATGYGMVCGIRSFWDNSEEFKTGRSRVAEQGSTNAKPISGDISTKSRSKKTVGTRDAIADDEERPKRRGGAGN